MLRADVKFWYPQIEPSRYCILEDNHKETVQVLPTHTVAVPGAVLDLFH